MAFDLDEWKTAVLAMAQGMMKADELLQASGLISVDYVEQDIVDLMRAIGNDGNYVSCKHVRV